MSTMKESLDFYASLMPNLDKMYVISKLYEPKKAIGSGGGSSGFVIFSDASQPEPKLRIIRRDFAWFEAKDYGVDQAKDAWLPKTVLSKFGQPNSINYYQSYNFYIIFLNYKGWTTHYFGATADSSDLYPSGTRLCPGTILPDSPATALDVYIWQYSDRETSFLDMWFDLGTYERAGFTGLPTGQKREKFLTITDPQRIAKITNDLTTTGCTPILTP